MRNRRCCCYQEVRPSMPSCGVDVVLDSNVHCTRVCEKIQYTATIVNNTNMTLNCVGLDLNVNPALCIDPDTITLNGTKVENANPNYINVGTIAANESAIVTFTATVMECKRYIRSKVVATYMVCCCLESRCVTTLSNIDCVQVCCCCGCNCNNNN